MRSTEDLAERFTRWGSLVGADDDEAAALWSAVHGLYTEPGRHYHDLVHIASSLGHLDRVKPGDQSMEGAIWFHDVIYDPTRGDNEVKSAEFFRERTPWIAKELSEVIARLILATDPRTPRSDASDEALMVDIDLAILGSATEDYDAYSLAIRKEYAHVSDSDFRKGRSAVMAKFLERPIYLTSAFQDREAPARQNIARELAALKEV